MRAVGVLLKLCRHPAFLLPRHLQLWRARAGLPQEPRGTTSNSLAGSPASSELWTPRDSTASQAFSELDNRSFNNDNAYMGDQWFQQVLDLDQTCIESLREASGKLQFLVLLLPRLRAQGHRCLLFSQSVQMLELVKATIMLPLKLSFVQIDGSIVNEVRQRRIQEFNNDTSVFAMLLTTKVGGQGLHLTSADRAVIIDPDWTPANDCQAVARIHRLGQKKNVVIYRLFTPGAIEDHAFRLQTVKQGLAKATMESTHHKTYFSDSDLKHIFTLRSRGTAETQRILESVETSHLRQQELTERIASDVGSQTLEKMWSLVEGFSDFDVLYSTLLTKSLEGVPKATSRGPGEPLVEDVGQVPSSGRGTATSSDRPIQWSRNLRQTEIPWLSTASQSTLQ